MKLFGWGSRRQAKPRRIEAKQPKHVTLSRFESLEDRLLMTATPVKVASVFADNRGLVEIRVTKNLQAGSVNKKTFRVFVGGPDGSLGTPDDVQVAASVNYDAATKTMTLHCSVPSDTNYRVKVYSSGIIDTDGLHLDGEYNSTTHTTLPSGDGVAGGDFQFRTKRDSSNTPVAWITTQLGRFNARLNKTAAPITVANFLAYANSGRFDGTIIHRNGNADPGGALPVLQGGSFYSNLSAVPTFPPIVLEQTGLLNLRGTLSMARTAAADSATSGFFINTQNNPALDPTGPGTGYAVFATISSGLNVVDAINALPADINVGNTFFAPDRGSQQFVTFSRVAIQMKVAPVT
jgi:cyclophilin family peptidyl-prolyl cis-trans isomerase